MIKLLFFAQLADQAGKEFHNLEFEEGISSREVVNRLEASMPKELIDSLRFDAVMLSVNQVMADWDHVLNDGDEVAFLPPFSGG
ncbi:MAG: molybdopterin synthase sulfur carrier subunit [Arenicella sp.]|jgi:molybdopterin synthase sulfur carrier subunit